MHYQLYFFKVSSLDPMLDDNIEFKKRLDEIGNSNCKVHVLHNLCHGFLNFSHVNVDCQQASRFVSDVIKLSFNL